MMNRPSKLQKYNYKLEPLKENLVAKKEDYIPLMKKMKNSTLRFVAEKFPLDHEQPDFQKKFDSRLEITKAFYSEFKRRNMKGIAKGNNLYYFNEWKKNQWFAVKVIAGMVLVLGIVSLVVCFYS